MMYINDDLCIALSMKMVAWDPTATKVLNHQRVRIPLLGSGALELVRVTDSGFHTQVEVSSKYSTVDTLRQEYVFVPAKYKDCYATYMLNELAGSTCMMFTRTCEATRKMAFMLRNLVRVFSHSMRDHSKEVNRYLGVF
jgi:hypothetical protein